MSKTADLGEIGHVDSGDFIELEHTSSKSDRADSGEEGHGDSDDWELDRYTELERSTILATVGRGISRVIFVKMREEVTENEITAFCVNLTANKKIKTLDVEGAHLFSSRTGCTLLGNALATNPAIETLAFRSVGMGSDGVSCLMKGLQRNRILERLHLTENPLGDEGVTLVAGFLNNAKFPLRALELRDVGASNEGVRYLVKSLQLCETLESLALSSNPLGDDGVSSVAELLASSTALKTLDLRSVGCGLEGAKHLSSALARNTSLAELGLGMFYEVDDDDHDDHDDDDHDYDDDDHDDHDDHDDEDDEDDENDDSDYDDNEEKKYESYITIVSMFFIDQGGRQSRYEETQSTEYNNLEGNAMLGINLVEGINLVTE